VLTGVPLVNIDPRVYAVDFLHVDIARRDVETGDLSRYIALLGGLMENAYRIRRFRGRIRLGFLGYEDHRSDVFEIIEVRNFASQLDDAFPFWLFFLSLDSSGLREIALSLLPPYLKPEAQVRIHSERLTELLKSRWVPAMKDVCETAGFNQSESDAMLVNVAEYFRNGPFRVFNPVVGRSRVAESYATPSPDGNDLGMELWEYPEARIDTLVVMASRKEVEEGDIRGAKTMLRKLLRPEVARRARGRLVFGVKGYDDDPRELYQVPAVCAWMRELDREFPYWFYFMDVGPRSTLSFVAFALCEFERVPGGSRIPPDELARFMGAHFLAMNEIAAVLGDSQSESDERSREVSAFFSR
jgi:hypothetical protein